MFARITRALERSGEAYVTFPQNWAGCIRARPPDINAPMFEIARVEK